MIRIGYACINTQLPSPNKTTRLSNASPERVIELSRLNLSALGEILRWNAAHGIQVFRVSSDTIPLASHPAVQFPWWEALAPELNQVSEIIHSNGARVSLHPGQYTVLNSPRPAVVEAAIAELDYHARLLDALGTAQSSKIVLHLGGVYGDKTASLLRFAQNYRRLPERVQRRLVLENDERSYTTADALALSEEIGAPVVFDVFHHGWNPSLQDLSLAHIVERCAKTWSQTDGPAKLHYSNQWPGKPPGSHSPSIDLHAFGDYFRTALLPVSQVRPLDVMLEVKDKEQSALKAVELLDKI